MTFGPQKSLFRSRSHFSRFRPPESAKFYKHYKGFAAVARAGAKSADFAKFSGNSTFGAKMVPKVSLSVFGSQKRLVAPRLADVPVANGFLMFLRSPGAKMRLLRSKITFAHFSDFGAQKSLLGAKVTFGRKSDF